MYQPTSQFLTDAFRGFTQCLQGYVIFVVQLRPQPLSAMLLFIYVTDRSSYYWAFCNGICRERRQINQNKMK